MADYVKKSNTMDKTFSSRMKSIFPIIIRNIYDIPDGTIFPKWLREYIYKFMTDMNGEEASLEFLSINNHSINSSTMRIVLLGGYRNQGATRHREIRDMLEFKMSNKKLEKIYMRVNKVNEIIFKSNKADLLPRLKKEAIQRSITLNDLILTALENELRKTYALNISLQIAPNDKRTLFSRASAYLDMGYYGLSLKDYDHLIRQGNKVAFFHRAVVYFKMDKIDKAKRDIKTYLKSDPKSHEAHYFLGKIYLSVGQIKYGIGEMKIARKLGSFEAENHLLSQDIIKPKMKDLR